MKKSAFIALIFGLILTGCMDTRLYQGPKLFTIYNDNSLEWRLQEYALEGKIYAIKGSEFEHIRVRIDLTPAFKIEYPHNFLQDDNVFIALLDVFGIPPDYDKPMKIEYGESCHQYVKKRGRDEMRLGIGFTSKQSDKYQFDTAKVYLTTSSQTYHLQLIDSTGKPLNDRIYEVKSFNYSEFPDTRYRLPVICEQLDGASFEISGIYKNGVELPPIKFQISLFEQDPRLLFKQDY